MLGAAKRPVHGRCPRATRIVVFHNPMQFYLWFVLIIITSLCLIGLTIILRGAYRESKLRCGNARVRKRVQSETVVRVRSASAGAHSG
jgi:hypothetical protein